MSEKRRYRKFTAQPKSELVLESLRRQMTIAELCREHEISETRNARSTRSSQTRTPGTRSPSSAVLRDGDRAPEWARGDRRDPRLRARTAAARPRLLTCPSSTSG